MRVTVTRIEQDGTMLRRVVSTARRIDAPRWEGLAGRALAQRLPPEAALHLVLGMALLQGAFALEAIEAVCPG